MCECVGVCICECVDVRVSTNNLCTVIQEEHCMYAHGAGAKLENGITSYACMYVPPGTEVWFISLYVECDAPQHLRKEEHT